MATQRSDERLDAAWQHVREVMADRAMRIAMIAGGVYVAAYLAATLILPEASPQAKVLVDIVYLLPELAGVGLLVAAARRSRRFGWFWYMAAAATFASLVGDVNWAVYDLALGRPPSPSPGDIAYVAEPVILLLAIVVACRRLRPRLRDLPDLAIPFGASLFAVYDLVIEPQLAGGLTAATIPSVTQAIAFVLVAVLATWIVAGHRGLPVSVHLFYGSVIASAVSYPFYAYGVSVSSWQRLNWVYTGWQLAYLLAALAGLAVLRLGEPAQRPVRVANDVNVWLISGGLVLVLAVIAMTTRGGRVDPRAPLIALAAVVIVIVRLHQIVRQRGRLAADLARSLAAQQRLVTTDPITDLPNQRAFQHVLRATLSAAEAGSPVSLLVFDLDQFGRINDGYGHAAGDLVLRRVAQRLHAAIRAEHTLARVGGEEFAVLAPGIDRLGLLALAERCRAAVAGQPFTVDQHQVGLTGSVGAAVYPDDAGDAEALVQVAFRALRQAKRHGGNRVHSGSRGVHVRTLPVPDTSAYSFLEGLADRLDAEQAEQEHSLAMLDLAGQLCDRLQLSTAQRRRCLLAARFHDLGKVGVPKAVLMKRAPLSEQEWAFMREHVRIGVDLLSRCAETREVAGIVGEHHERPDGRGYPDGRPARLISIEASVISAADAWTAMRADRPYRDALTPEQARAQLVAGRGSQFHEQVCDALLDIVDEQQAGSCAA